MLFPTKWIFFSIHFMVQRKFINTYRQGHFLVEHLANLPCSHIHVWKQMCHDIPLEINNPQTSVIWDILWNPQIRRKSWIFLTRCFTVQAWGVSKRELACMEPLQVLSTVLWGRKTFCWTPTRFQALMQAFSSDLIFTRILWGSRHPVFQTGNRRLEHFVRQLSGWPNIWIQSQLSP